MSSSSVENYAVYRVGMIVPTVLRVSRPPAHNLEIISQIRKCVYKMYTFKREGSLRLLFSLGTVLYHGSEVTPCNKIDNLKPLLLHKKP